MQAALRAVNLNDIVQSADIIIRTSQEKCSVVCLARIRTEGEGGAWCPKDQILKGGNEFLQIDLGSLKVITLVETQGRFGNGQVNLSKKMNQPLTRSLQKCESCGFFEGFHKEFLFKWQANQPPKPS